MIIGARHVTATCGTAEPLARTVVIGLNPFFLPGPSFKAGPGTFVDAGFWRWARKGQLPLAG